MKSSFVLRQFINLEMKPHRGDPVNPSWPYRGESALGKLPALRRLASPDPERKLVASPARTGADDKADIAVTVLGVSFKTDQTPLSIYFSSSSRAKDGPDRTSAMLSEAPVRMPGSLST